MSELFLPCPACDSLSTKEIGPIVRREGLIALADSSTLYQCLTCGLLYRRPYPSQDDLLQYYGGLQASNWYYSEDRKDYNLASNYIQKHISSGSILDIGCFRGDFLNNLPKRYQKYGIEPSEPASLLAQERGIELIGNSIDNYKKNNKFNVITLLDVFEHLPRPMDCMQNIIESLKPNGILIVSTGNTDCLTWRFMRLDYWYYFSEHVSFFNPQWFQWASEHLNLNIIKMIKYSHFENSLADRWMDLSKSIIFSIVKVTTRYPHIHKPIISIFPFNKSKKWTSPPITRNWKDHMLVVLKRNH